MIFHKLVILIVGTAVCLPANAQSSAGAQVSGQESVAPSGPRAQASGAASSSASATPESGNAGLSAGTTFNTSLEKPVDAKKAKAGDAVEARTTEAVKADKKTVFPKGTKVIGHVTRASARGKEESQSTLAIAFDRAILKDGTEVPLSVGIQALASSESMVSASEADADTMGVGSAGASAAGSSRGTLGGVGSTAGGMVGNAGATTGNVVNTAGATASSATNATANVAGAARGTAGGLNGAGQLTSNSRGVFGLNGLNLGSATTSATEGSVITSADKNIHLASGTRMLLVTRSEGAHANP